MADARRMGKSELFSHFAERFETGIDAERLTRLTQISRAFDELLDARMTGRYVVDFSLG